MDAKFNLEPFEFVHGERPVSLSISTTKHDYHWPRGPFPIHSGSIDECKKFWCAIFGQHKYCVDCSCGWHICSKRLEDATATASEHLANVRLEKLQGE